MYMSVEIFSESQSSVRSKNIDDFVSYINKNIKEIGKASEADRSKVEKNNYIYFLAKTGISCMSSKN